MYVMNSNHFTVIEDAANFRGDYNEEFRMDCVLFLCGNRTWNQMKKYF